MESGGRIPGKAPASHPERRFCRIGGTCNVKDRDAFSASRSFFVIPRGGAGGAKACSGEGPGTGLFVRGPAFRAVSPPVPSPTAAKKPAVPLACGFLVPVTGIEPVRCFHRQILSLLRLPISPHRQILAHLVYHSPQENAREAQRNQAALGNMIQLWGAAPSRPKSRLRRLILKRACG